MRFNGRYLSAISQNRVYINLKLADGTKEFYSFDIPRTAAKNLIIGKPYIDVVGKIQIINHTTTEICELEFKEKGWNSKNAQAVVGVVKTTSG